MDYQRSKIYIIGDGDDIRLQLERYLFENEIVDLNAFSNSLNDAITRIKQKVISDLKAEIILAGGDDIIIQVDKNLYDQKYFLKVIDYFKEHTGCTMSFGVGKTIEIAYLNLMKAKAKGKANIVAEK